MEQEYFDYDTAINTFVGSCGKCKITSNLDDHPYAKERYIIVSILPPLSIINREVEEPHMRLIGDNYVVYLPSDDDLSLCIELDKTEYTEKFIKLDECLNKLSRNHYFGWYPRTSCHKILNLPGEIIILHDYHLNKSSIEFLNQNRNVKPICFGFLGVLIATLADRDDYVAYLPDRTYSWNNEFYNLCMHDTTFHFTSAQIKKLPRPFRETTALCNIFDLYGIEYEFSPNNCKWVNVFQFLEDEFNINTIDNDFKNYIVTGKTQVKLTKEFIDLVINYVDDGHQIYWLSVYTSDIDVLLRMLLKCSVGRAEFLYYMYLYKRDLYHQLVDKWLENYSADQKDYKVEFLLNILKNNTNVKRSPN